MKKTAVLYLVPLIILLVGCGSGNKTTPVAREPAVGTENGGVPVTQLPSLPSREVSRAAPNAQEPEQKELPLGTREKLPFRNIPEPVLPEDRIIGPLGGQESDRPVLSVVVPLMETLAQGGKPEKALLSKTTLEGQDLYWERFFLDFPEGEYSYRLGEVNNYTPGSASVNCRLFRPLPEGSRAVAEGEFILENQEGHWKVAGLNFNRRDLDKPYQPLSEPFEPQVYRWLQLY